VGEAVGIAGTEDEACAKLEGVFAEFVLVVAGGIGTFARDRVVAAQEVEKVRTPQFGSAVGGAVRIDQKRKRDASFFAEYPRIAKIAHADRCDLRATRFDFGFMLAQLRDVLAAEDSAVVAQENDDGWLRLPQ
jgi:hypothetical protein